jgi:hypothetical protein
MTFWRQGWQFDSQSSAAVSGAGRIDAVEAFKRIMQDSTENRDAAGYPVAPSIRR